MGRESHSLPTKYLIALYGVLLYNGSAGKGEPGVKSLLKLLPVALLALIIAAICGATFAMYRLGTSANATIQAKNYQFAVNGSSSQTLSLGIDAALAPGERREIPVKLSAAGSEVAVNARVTLVAECTGALPPGFMIYLDGAPAAGNQTLTAVMDYADIHAQDITVTVLVSWDDPGDIDYQTYADFSMDVYMLVESEQAV